MRIVLADLKGGEGFISKDTVAGGYGSRLRPFSKVTSVIAGLKRGFHDLPSVHLAYAAALAERAGHTVVVSSGEIVGGDVALVLSSLVDYRRETAWAASVRALGVRVGFIGLAAAKMPQLFEPAADFVIKGEPEAALLRLMQGETLAGIVDSPAIDDLDALPFPQWEQLAGTRRRFRVPFAGRPVGGSLPVLASRSCPEFCTYCPHRILAGYRSRSVGNILDELSYLADTRGHVHAVFRDPLFTQERDRVLALCDGILSRGLKHTFECETRLDRLDEELLSAMHRAGLRAMSFGVEAVSSATLKKVGRRPIPEAHQRAMLAHCRTLGVVTAAFYVLGFGDDTWDSASATIDYSVQVGSTVAQFKLLTPYPGTPLYSRMESTITETDWEQFDGFTPTFTHAQLSHTQLRYLLGAAYTRFYVRPSFLTNYLRIRAPWAGRLVSGLDGHVERMHARRELAIRERALSC
jgi:anaerobic magnesium-protoporphyrin IX monomethyl ester cyclase